jgi:hypothetical protein
MRAVKWFDRSDRSWAVGVEDDDRALVFLPAKYAGARGLSAIYVGTRGQADEVLATLRTDIKDGTFAPDDWPYT